MPSITPQVRAQIGGSHSDYTSPRATVTANTQTGTSYAKAPAVRPQGLQAQAPLAPKPGHSDIGEETKPEAVTLSAHLTAVARKQQKLQAEIQAQRHKEAEFEKQKADYIPKSAIQAKAKENIVEALKDLGFDYEQITSLVLAQQNGPDPLRELTREVETLKKSQADNATKQYDAILRQYKAETVSLVSADPKAFHFINKNRLQDAVVTHIVETWEDNPDSVLTVAQAAKEVEEVLRENARAQADALKELDPPADETAQLPKKTLPPPQRAATRTLTSQVEGAPAARPQSQMQHLSARDRLQEAIRRAQR